MGNKGALFMSKHRTHRYTSIRHNLDGSRTKSVTRFYRTAFNNTRSYTYSRRTGGHSSNANGYHRTGSDGSSKGAGCGTVLLIVFGFGIIIYLLKALVEGVKKGTNYISENMGVFVICLIAIIVLISLVVLIRRRLKNRCDVDDERMGNELLDKNTDQSEWHQQTEHLTNQKNEDDSRALLSGIRDMTSSTDQEGCANQKTALQRQQEFIEELQERPKKKRSKRGEPKADNETGFVAVPYNYPPITDLVMPQRSNNYLEEENLCDKLEQILASFNVQSRVVHITHGPFMTRYEMEIASGTKANKVAELEKEIMYGLAKTSVLIEAPIPGKGLIGVSVPNARKGIVRLREVLESNQVYKSKSLLNIPLGKDRLGNVISCDLAKLPHLLIAGQTGSGKTICIDSIITSILYRFTPDEIKLIFIDFKGVGLQNFQGIPHLLIPVVNRIDKVEATLAWIFAEIRDRYDCFIKRKVQSIDEYTNVISSKEKPLSHIITIIDGLDDLTLNKNATDLLVKIASEGGAAGIHLILSSQRPSFDNVVGELKNNLPGRIAFKVGSHYDSQIILGQSGAEKLNGCGDMLYLPKGAVEPIWIQGCFIGSEEMNKVIDHVKMANPCIYNSDVLEKIETIMQSENADLLSNQKNETVSNDGSLFEAAVEIAITDGQISTSTVQRRLKIGYARAGRLIDELEWRGIIGPREGGKPSKCYISRETWEEMKRAAEG